MSGTASVPNTFQSAVTATGLQLDQNYSTIVAYLNDPTNRNNYAADTGNTATFAIALSPPATGYTAGMPITFKTANASAAAVQVNVNALGAKNIIDQNGNALVLNAYPAGSIVHAVYNGSAFVAISAPYVWQGPLNISTNSDTAIGTLTNGTKAAMITFSKTGFTERASFGAGGSFEANMGYNWDNMSQPGIHRLFDNTKNGWNVAINTNGYYIQYAPATTVTTDIWVAGGSLYNFVSDTAGIFLARGGISTQSTLASGASNGIKSSSYHTNIVECVDTTFGTLGTVSTAADGTGTEAGRVTFDFTSNSANHKTLAYLSVVTEGATANQRGAYVSLKIKPNGSTTLTEYSRTTSQGFTKFTNSGAFVSATGTYHELSSNSAGDPVVRVYHTDATNPLGIYCIYSGGAPNDTAHVFLLASDNAAVRAELRSNGGLANFSANNVNLSTVEVKEAFEPIQTSWQKVLGVRQSIQYFQYKDATNKADGNSWCCSPMAEDVERYFPDYVAMFDAERGLKGVREQPLTWEIIGNLIDEIDSLRQKVAALQKASPPPQENSG